MSKKKDFFAHVLVMSLAAIPAAFVKQCSKNADQIEFRQRYSTSSSDWGTSPYSKFSDPDYNKINWVNPSDLPYPNKKNEVIIEYDEGLSLPDVEMPSSIQLISSIPDTPQEFNNIFSKNPSIADMDDANTSLKELNSTHIDGSYISSKNSDSLLDGITSSNESIVVILGHNDNGFLKFGDGSVLKLSDISLKCKQYEKHCVFISCKSKLFVDQNYPSLDYNIILSDAVTLVRELIRNVQKRDSVSLKEIDTYLTESISKIHFYNGTKITIKIGSAAGTISLVIYEINVSEGDENSDVVSYAKSLFIRTSYEYEDLDKRYDAYSELILRYGGSDNPDLQRLIAQVKIRQGATLSKQERTNEAIEIIDSLISVYRDLDGDENQELLANLLYSKAGVFWRAERFDLAASEYDNLIANFEDSKEDNFGSVVAQAMLNKAYVLNDMGLSDGEITIYDQVIKRYGSLEKIKYQHYTAQALYRKAVRLTKLGRFKQSLGTYDDLIEKFRTMSDDYMSAKGYTPMAERGEYWAKFGDHKLKDEITEYLLSSLGNSTEISFFIESPTDTLSRAEEVLSKVSPADDLILIYDFFFHAARNDKSSCSKLCHSINALKVKPNLNWDFKEIDLLMIEVFDSRRDELSQFVSFLKGEVDKSELDSVCQLQNNLCSEGDC